MDMMIPILARFTARPRFTAAIEKAGTIGVEFTSVIIALSARYFAAFIVNEELLPASATNALCRVICYF